MKKHVLILLAVLGVAVGSWLAKENTELVRLLFPALQPPRETIYPRPIDVNRIALGMETWQVKEVLGPPDERSVSTANQDTRKERWIYGNKCLSFTNGVLTSWQDIQE